MNIVKMREGHGLTELERFYDAIPCVEQLVCVELGSYAGQSSVIAAERVKKLYCVDPFEWDKTEDEYGPEDIFDARIAPFGDKVVKMKMRSKEALLEFEDKSVDMVYIDGMHDRYNITHDILLWIPKIKVHGLICGHDFTPIPAHAGVVASVRHLLGEPKDVHMDGSWRFSIDVIRDKITTATLEEN